MEAMLNNPGPTANLKGKPIARTSLMNLSVEEENLAAIPFAVLERLAGEIEINDKRRCCRGLRRCLVC